MPPVNTIVTTQFTLPTVIFANGQVTGNPWNNPTNLFLVDGDVASSNVNQGAASDVTVGGYNFLYNGISIPQGAVITGIELEVIGYRGAQTSPPITLDISFYDNVNGADDFYPYTTGFTGLTPTMTTTVLGTQNYLFATSFTVDQINNMKMNLQANGDVNLDSFLVRVYFYIPASATPPVVTPGVCISCESPIQIQEMRLARPFLVGQDKFYIQKGGFSYPNGTPVQPGDVGSCGGKIPFVFDEGKSKSDQNGGYEENAVLDTTIGSWTVLPSGVIEIDLGDVTQRGLDYKTPGTHVAALMSNHDANSSVIVTNNTPYNLSLVRRCQAGTVFSEPIEVLENGVSKVIPMTKANFSGSVTVTQDLVDPEQANIVVTAGGGTTPPSVAAVANYTSFDVQVPSGQAVLTVIGLNRAGVVQILTEEIATISSVTIGGVSCTMAVSQTDAGTNQRNEIWTCVNPPLGSQIVEVTLSQDAYLTFGVEALAQVDTAALLGSLSTDVATSLNPSVDVITDRDNSIVIDSLGTAQTPILYTVGAGQALNWSYTANNVTRQGGSSVEAAGLQPDTVTMDYTITQNTRWTMCAVEIHGITTAPVSNDHKVAVTGADTTPNYLASKLVAGTNVTLTTLNPGANEQIQIDVTGGSGPSAATVSATITQAAHGFTVGYPTAIRKNAAGNYVASLAVKTSPTDLSAEVIGIAVASSVNDFVIYYNGQVPTTTTPFSALAQGTPLYVSASVAGQLTDVEPTGINEVSKPIAYVDIETGATARIVLQNMRGLEDGGSAGANYTVNADEAQSDDLTTVIDLPWDAGINQYVQGFTVQNASFTKGSFATLFGNLNSGYAYNRLFKNLSVGFDTIKEVRLKFNAATTGSAGSDKVAVGLSRTFNNTGNQIPASETNICESARFVFSSANTIYMAVSDDTGNTNTSTTAYTVSTSVFNVYEIVFIPGVSVEFWINGTLVANPTTDIPSTANDVCFFMSNNTGLGGSINISKPVISIKR